MPKVSGAIKIDNLASQVNELLTTYGEEIQEAVSEETKSVAQYGRDKLRLVTMPSATSVGSAKPMTRREWNNYASSWSVTERASKGKTSGIVHNKKYYRLTHLLELGHRTANGTTTRAFKHIDPINEECQKMFEKNVEEIIKRGGK